MASADLEHRPQLSHTTVFLRNRPQLEELAKGLLPFVFATRRATELDALVCGGSIGCEAFSLAIALREFGGGQFSARTLSVDIVETVAAQGRAGRFPAETFRPLYAMEGGMPDDLRDRWFTFEADGGCWQAIPDLQAMVGFQTIDLAAEPLGRPFDLLVCQNVLTHLHPPAATALLGALLTHARRRSVLVCSGLDLDLKAHLAAAGFQPWTGRLEEIHDAFASHRMHYRLNRGQHYFELEDIDRARPDWETRFSTLFYRLE